MPDTKEKDNSLNATSSMHDTLGKMQPDLDLSKKLVVQCEGRTFNFSPPFRDKSHDNAGTDLAWLKLQCLERLTSDSACLRKTGTSSSLQQNETCYEGKHATELHIPVLEEYTFRRKSEAVADKVSLQSLFSGIEDGRESRSNASTVELELVRQSVEVRPLPLQVEIQMRRFPDRKHDRSGHVYTAYVLQIKLNGVEWEIARRYREFALLDKKLRSRFFAAHKESGRHWPKFPPKERMKLHSNGTKTVRVRTEKLWYYIQEVAKDQLIMKDPPVELLEFLGIVRQEPVQDETIHIHQLQAKGVLNVGDIVLFKSCYGGAKLQRNVTRSSWDHVGIVVPIAKGDTQEHSEITMGILEATREGIEVCSFFQRIVSMRDYAVIAVRHLCVDRNGTFLSKLEAFVKDVELKRYSLRGLLARVLPFYNPEKDVFCSQLVAQALIKLNCMGSDKKSALFWPVSFSPGGAVDRALARHKVATLSPMKIIDFKVNEIYQCRHAS